MCLRIFHDTLGLSKFDRHWISHTLDQKLTNEKVSYSNFLLVELEEAKMTCFKRVITGGNSWVFLDDPSGAMQAETRFSPPEMPK
jgi:hypothetical protein